MLTYERLKNWAGIAIFGDYLSLRSLHEIVHDVNDRSPIIRDKEGFFLGLAYDLRKAYQGERLKDEARPEVGARYGVEFLWPAILVQSRQLRDSLAYIDHTKEHQAVTYGLESILEDAISREFEGKSEAIRTEWQRLQPSQSFLEDNVETRVAQFAAWASSERQRGLAGLLASLDPIYPSSYLVWIRQGRTDLVSPNDFEVWREREFPDVSLDFASPEDDAEVTARPK
jgi:hypothetical protein